MLSVRKRVTFYSPVTLWRLQVYPWRSVGVYVRTTVSLCVYRYIGRPPSATVAAGNKAVYKHEQETLVQGAFSL